MAEYPVLALNVRRATCCGKWVSVFDPVQTSICCGPPTNTVAEPDVSSEIEAPMHNSDYYREQADYYRLLAAAAENAAAKQDFLELAATCEEVADEIDDCRASG
jgi:hypothetical protein